MPQVSARQVAAGAGIFAAVAAGVAALFGWKKKGKSED